MSDPNIDERNRVAALLRQFHEVEKAGAAMSHAERTRRSEVLEELQDAVGLSGKMVMERDILRRAEQALRD